MRLTAIGRRTGRRRSVIVGYCEDGPNLVTMAMNGWGSRRACLVAQPAGAPGRRGRLAGGARLVRPRAAAGDERVASVSSVARDIRTWTPMRRFGRPRPRLWSSSRGPGLIDFDFIDGTRMAQALGQAAEEACIASLRTRRMPYTAVLTVVTAMTAGYTAWAGIGVTKLLTTCRPGACSPPRPDPPVRAGDPQLRAVHLLLGPLPWTSPWTVLNGPRPRAPASSRPASPAVAGGISLWRLTRCWLVSAAATIVLAVPCLWLRCFAFTRPAPGCLAGLTVLASGTNCPSQPGRLRYGVQRWR
jgi:hypothetical protein